MSRRAGWALTVAAIAIFLLLNRAAYKGHFQDDEGVDIALVESAGVLRHVREYVQKETVGTGRENAMSVHVFSKPLSRDTRLRNAQTVHLAKGCLGFAD